MKYIKKNSKKGEISIFSGKNKMLFQVRQRFSSVCFLFFLIAVFLGFSDVLPAQNSLDNWSVGANVCYGKFFKHSKKQIFQVNNPATGFSLDFMNQSTGKAMWAKQHKLPRAGLGFIYLNYGAPDTLGKAIGFYPQIDTWLLRTPRFTLYTRMTFGVAYLTKRYDRITNPRNTAIGSHINNYTTIGLSAEYQLTNHLALRAAAHFAHSSNGKLRVPNLGLNTGFLNLGLNYRFSADLPLDTIALPKDYVYSQKPLFGLRASIGIKEANVANGPFYYVWMLTPHVIFPRNEKHQWEAGAEFTFDGEAREAYLNGEGFGSTNTSIKPWSASVYGGHEFLFGRIGFVSQLHWYLFPFMQPKNEFYTLIGGKIYLNDFHKHPRNQFYTGIFLKSHYTVAQYPSVILGATF